MVWTAPRTWAVGEVVTGANMNTHVRDNFRFLKGLDGTVLYDEAINVGTYYVLFGDAAGSSTVAGRMQRNGTLLQWGDGTNVRTVVFTGLAQTLTDKTITTGTFNGGVFATGTLTGGTVSNYIAFIDAAGSSTVSGRMQRNGTLLQWGDGTNVQTVVLTTLTGTLINKTLGSSNAVSEPALSFTDVTTANATTGQHGLLPKLGGGTVNFLNATGSWAAPASGALTRAGGNTTEATTTSLTAVDLLSVASLSIAVGTPVSLRAVLRKTSGAADTIRHGLKLNTTVTADGQAYGSTSNAAQSLPLWHDFIYGVANHLQGGWGTQSGSGTPSSWSGFSSPANMPTATLTDIIFRGDTDDALITLGVDEFHVYPHAVS